MLIELLDTLVSKVGVLGTLGIGGGIAALIKNFAKTNQRLYFKLSYSFNWVIIDKEIA